MMLNLSSITIDSGVIAVPQAGEDAHKYIETLLCWSNLIDEHWITISMSERTSEVLCDDNLYPFQNNNIGNLLDLHEIDEYATKDILSIVGKLINKARSFEAHYKLEDVLTDSLETTPDIINLASSEKLKENLERCVAMIAILRQYCLQPPGGHILVLRKTPENKKIITVSAQILEIEHARDDLPALHSHPDFFNFKGDAAVCDDFRGLINCIDEAEILRSAAEVSDIELAIKIAIFKNEIERGSEPDWNQISLPSIGKKFLDSYKDVCKGADKLPQKILRAIIETVYKENLRAVHTLRKSNSGSAQNIMRANDKAQRRDIDYNFHLHYWDCENGTVELASVVNHDDFSIPY